MSYPAAIAPPGRALIETCPDCTGTGSYRGEECLMCEGTGRCLLRACPACGDVGWDYVNGVDDSEGMACRLGCGYRWLRDDPGWLAQRLPV
jgi:hypothetical protein